MYLKGVLFLLLLNSCANVSSHISGITFENGQYNNILIALSDELDISTCKSLLSGIQSTLKALSEKLHSATESKASIRSVDILFPSSWGRLDAQRECEIANINITKEIQVFQSYKTADIKITDNHPISKVFPWSKQYKPCGNESETIYVSPAFLNRTDLDLVTKGNFLLHEWAKFRYGVFEEYGFFEDALYSPCYSKGGKSHFTTCSNATLNSIHPSSADSIDCRTAVTNNNDAIRADLIKSSSSVMGSPHLSNISEFCDSSNHNIFAPTKHNSLCGRKSVKEVILSHKDFRGSDKSTFQNNIIIRYLQRQVQKQGYAFVIEDSPTMRQFDRLRLVKQSITQMVDLLPLGVTEVVLQTFNGNITDESIHPFDSNEQKLEFVEHLPDVITAPLTRAKNGKQLGGVFQKIVDRLNNRQTYEYNIIYIGAQTSVTSETAAAIETVKNSRHALSIVTFDDSVEWLDWNSIPNTKKVLYFPSCTGTSGRNLCNSKLSSLLTDSLLETLGYSQSRFFHKISEIKMNQTRISFSIDTFDKATNLVVVIPVFNDNSDVSSLLHFETPMSDRCAAKRMLNYNNTVQMDTSSPSCQFQNGSWEVVVNETFVKPDDPHILVVYLETKEGASDLSVTTGIGHSLDDTLDPSTGLIPIYATVSSSSDLPVIGAQVSVDLFSGTELVPTTFDLKDDGHFPDNTKGDGVYSAIIKGYSTFPATHLGQIHVKTDTSAKAIISLPASGNAALIDSHRTLFSQKCCGSSVVVEESGLQPVGRSSYSVFTPSFKTAVNSDPSRIPPSKIESVKIAYQNDTWVDLQFMAPGRNYDSGVVSRYDICCYPEENQSNPQCENIPNDECKPVDEGQTQNCMIRISLLSEMVMDPGSSLYLHCGIRGVNSADVPGEISGNIVEIQVRADGDSGSSKCDSISDGCLPIWIFWVLIGCVGLLSLIVLILIISWCCVARRNPAQQKTTPNKNYKKNKKNKTGKIPDKDSPLYNVYVNQAYIQDTDGQLKLVASDGELLPYDTKTNERGDDLGYATQNSGPQTPVMNSQRVPTVRRRSLSAHAQEPENVSSFKPVDTSRKHVSWNQEKNMPVFSVMKDEDYDIDYSAMKFDKPNLTRNISKSEEFIKVTPKAKDRHPKSMAGYANPVVINNTKNETKMTPVPSITSTVDTYNRNDWLNSNGDDDNTSGPIYASVNRNGHRGVGSSKAGAPTSGTPYGGYDMNRNHTAIPAVPPSRESLTLKSAWNTNPMGAGRFTRGINNRNNRSMRLDAFPSSESETYSDISRGIPVPPPPPPLPTAADLNRPSTYKIPSKIPQNRTNGDGSDMTERNSSTNALNNPKPVLVSKSPPKDKSFAGIRNHMEQQLNNIYSNPNPKPLPPPRQDKFPLSSVSNASSFGSRVVEMGEVDDEDEYDEGSDYWDDGDDMDEYNPGHSYA